jgi:hypothetical protein
VIVAKAGEAGNAAKRIYIPRKRLTIAILLGYRPDFAGNALRVKVCRRRRLA